TRHHATTLTRVAKRSGGGRVARAEPRPPAVRRDLRRRRRDRESQSQNGRSGNPSGRRIATAHAKHWRSAKVHGPRARRIVDRVSRPQVLPRSSITCCPCLRSKESCRVERCPESTLRGASPLR